jgi:hypothetical protein
LETARQAAVRLLREDPTLELAENEEIRRAVRHLMDAMVTI